MKKIAFYTLGRLRVKVNMIAPIPAQCSIEWMAKRPLF